MSDAPGAQKVIIFLHLPKSAGSTLARIVVCQYGQGNVLQLYESLYGEQVAELTPGRQSNLRALLGHFYFGAHQYLSSPATYITLLRDPVERIISHYRFVRNDPAHYLYPVAQQLSLREYVIHCGKAEPNNDQVRLLAGREHSLEDGTCSEEMLPAAKKNLRESFSAIGLVEDFDRSLILMKRFLGWRMPFYVKQNVSRYPNGGSGIDPETVKVIRAYNQLDEDLHEYAKDLLAEQVRIHGDSLERELRLFQTLNAVYGRLNAVLAKANSPLCF